MQVACNAVIRIKGCWNTKPQSTIEEISKAVYIQNISIIQLFSSGGNIQIMSAVIIGSLNPKTPETPSFGGGDAARFVGDPPVLEIRGRTAWGA